jgi:hypothetical protein
MSEPHVERLSRFTPDRGALDRDALLFAAGRATARSNRGWIALAAVLAVSQGATLLFLLWPAHAAPVAPEQGSMQATVPAQPQAAPETETSTLWALERRLLDSDSLPPVLAAVDRLAPDGPPLRAFPGSFSISD